jgi:signal peptidase I
MTALSNAPEESDDVAADDGLGPLWSGLPTEPQPSFGASLRRRARWSLHHGLLPGARIVLWVFVNLTLLLTVWVGLGWGIGGWKPVVITSGSMEPTLGVGDVLLIDTHPAEELAQRAIVVFSRRGEQIAHRVFAVEPDGLVTKGDANPTPDPDRVQLTDVRGAGRLVVPVIGLPIVWVKDGNWVPLAAWLVLIGGAAVRVALAADHALFGRRRTAGRPRMPVGRVGIQRVRNLMAVLIVAQYVIDSDRLAVVRGAVGALGLVIAAVGTLLATNLLATWADRRERQRRLFALVELAIDTVLVVALATVTGSSGFSWVLFSLPIIEAAVRFRLVGALVHWMLLTVVTLAAKVWTGASGPSALVLDDLESLLDQLSVLFLVVVPAAYLAEQLIGEVSTWQRATGQAVDRSQLLVRVADIGRDIARIDGGPLQAILGGVRSLGFDRADLVVEEGRGSWRVFAGDELPTPGGAASCVRSEDVARGATFVDADDPDPDEVDALADAGLAAVLGQVVSEQHGQRIVLRAGLDDGHELSDELIEAFGLLAAQAAVALRNEQLVNEITTIHEELEHQAQHDALTGLPNRVLLLQRLSEARRSTAQPVMMFLDLNGFKPVNDRLGHDVGDVVLQMVGARLLDAVPDGALVARLGGDEFTVLLTGNMRLPDARRVALAIADAIKQPYEIGQDTVYISTSIGIAFGGDGIGEAELIRRADVAMYEAKHGAARELGFEIYRPEFDSDADRRAALVEAVAGALDTGEMAVAFQPIFSIDGDTALAPIAGAEALIRWHHPEYGIVPAADIIESARAASQQDRLNLHIIRTACAAASMWRARNPGSRCFVAVNASPEELGSRLLVTNVRQALEDSALPANLLHVEISERLVTPASDAVLANMDALRELGVVLLLDDFGEGKTSLSYLHELPVGGIKLDRRLVANSQRSRTDRMVLQSVVELCGRLGHVVIAEGIETPEHLDTVRDAGCTLAQGYYLGRPQSPESIDDLVRLSSEIASSLPAPVARAGVPLVAPVGTAPGVGGSPARPAPPDFRLRLRAAADPTAGPAAIDERQG